MRSVASLFGVIVLAAVSLVASPVTAQAADRIARVTGGGTADFIDNAPISPSTSGYTNFSVGVTVYDDGTASGHFMCQIPAIVIISGDVLGGWVNDDGSVTVWGLAHIYDHLYGPFWDVPFVTTFRAGGPGVGGFDYRDESGYFGPGQYDTEVVRRGMIRITP